MNRILAGVAPGAIAIAYALGLVGAGLAVLLGLPLPLLLGPLLVVGTVAAAQVRPLGVAPAVPQGWRMVLIPVVGVAIGGAFTPELAAEAVRWWPSLLALAVYVPAAQAVGYVIYRHVGGLDRPTALYSATPGGLFEAISMGEARGADIRMLTMLQFLRLILSIVTVPIIFLILTGAVVGSSSGVAMVGAEVPIGWWDAVLLIGAAVMGVWGAKKIGLPGPVIVGPMLVSGALHLAGLTKAIPPGWMVGLTQLVVGVSLGTRFAGMAGGKLLRAMWLSALTVGSMLGLGFLFALAIHGAVGEKAGTVFLAFAPGGVAEMSLVALSLQVSVVYVTAHHVARIVLSVLLLGVLDRWVRRP
jgi:membrane AbrB-like protein